MVEPFWGGVVGLHDEAVVVFWCLGFGVALWGLLDEVRLYSVRTQYSLETQRVCWESGLYLDALSVVFNFQHRSIIPRLISIMVFFFFFFFFFASYKMARGTGGGGLVCWVIGLYFVCLAVFFYFHQFMIQTSNF